MVQDSAKSQEPTPPIGAATPVTYRKLDMSNRSQVTAMESSY